MMQRYASLPTIGALAALAILPPSAHGLRRLDGLGKWKDGDATEIDCSTSSLDYDFYIERCYDEITQWWINGRCVDGVKEEVSELHRCMRPDGSRSHCHDCDDGKGNVKNVCGSDSPDGDEVCGIAWAGTAEDCGEQGLTTYAHQCVDRSGGSDHWYLRESFECDEEEVLLMGPMGEEVPPRTEFTCGVEWYYPFEEDDEGLLAINPEWIDVEQPFASASNDYCLDCGLAIQVCAGNGDATCEDLGLPPKGTDSRGWTPQGAAAVLVGPDSAAEPTGSCWWPRIIDCLLVVLLLPVIT